MTIGPALSTRPPFEPDEKTIFGGRFHDGSSGSIDDFIEANAATLIGQEAVTLSTTPAYVDGRLVPRPMSIRVFLGRTNDGWQVMPGGYARIGRTEDATAIAKQRGGSVADVWIVSDNPVATPTMLPAAGTTPRRSEPGVLPSRAADNLYWLGRYVERTEGIMRLMRAYHVRLAETANAKAPLLEFLQEYLYTIDVEIDVPVPAELRTTLSSARGSAARVRDRFSLDGWAALADLAKTAHQMAATAKPGDDAARAMGVLLRKITGFSGLVHENMYRSIGWRFLSLGRSLERALNMASVLATFADSKAPDGALDLAIEFGDSTLTHRSRYAVASNRGTVIELLGLDINNPRSILNNLTEIRDQATELSVALAQGQMSNLSRSILRTYADLAARTPETLDTATLTEIADHIGDLSDALSAEYLQ
jgi:uncharacterized alpha-E superfamily protein